VYEYTTTTRGNLHMPRIKAEYIWID